MVIVIYRDTQGSLMTGQLRSSEKVMGYGAKINKHHVDYDTIDRLTEGLKPHAGKLVQGTLILDLREEGSKQ